MGSALLAEFLGNGRGLDELAYRVGSLASGRQRRRTRMVSRGGDRPARSNEALVLGAIGKSLGFGTVRSSRP